MKRSLVTGAAVVALLAAAVPAGAAITNQLTRPELSAEPKTAFAEPPAPPIIEHEPTTTAPPTTEAPPTTKPAEPSTTTRAPEPEKPAPTTTAPKPERPAPDLKEPNFKLECAPKAADGKPVVLCRWTVPAVDGVAGYRVYRAVPNVDRNQIGVTHDPGFTDTNVVVGQKFLYGVEAFDANEQMVGRSNLVVVAVTLPQTVVRLSCGPQVVEAKRAVVCEWAGIDNPAAKAYQLYRSVGDGPKQLLTTVGPDGVKRYVDTDVKPGQTLYYKVIAVDANGNPLAYSEIIRVILPNEPAPSTTAASPTTRV